MMVVSTVYSFVLTIVSIIIPSILAVDAMSRSDRHSIRVWLIFFLTVTIYNGLILNTIEPFINTVFPVFVLVKITSLIAFLIPYFGLQDTYLNFIDNIISFKIMETRNRILNIFKPYKTKLSEFGYDFLQVELEKTEALEISKIISDGTTSIPDTPTDVSVPSFPESTIYQHEK
ncbi:hypothetical protein cand_030940 [Cryptosporidium andersoni]|uniref:Uncharacterized protein n=1 Tax=Cryptosporidium andersoni TaxID=117008 RepID=A0A1J4MNB7_9CRYT|nr:hypothetical protein cand_030940 [Cryptosporidium andersoni]